MYREVDPQALSDEQIAQVEGIVAAELATTNQ